MIEPTDEMMRAGAVAIAGAQLVPNEGTPEVYAEAAIRAVLPIVERDYLSVMADLIDADPCWFDHHGGCQAHGYLSLEPGEKCPHARAKELLGWGGQ